MPIDYQQMRRMQDSLIARTEAEVIAALHTRFGDPHEPGAARFHAVFPDDLARYVHHIVVGRRYPRSGRGEVCLSLARPLMHRLDRLAALCLASLCVACQDTWPASGNIPKENVMTAPAHPVAFEAIAQRLLQSPPTASALSQALGGPVVAPGSDVTFKLQAAPFTAVNISEFRGDVDLVFDLAAGPWAFRDVVAEPSAWSSGPRLPGSGVLESTRTWTAPGRSVTCVVRLDGEGPLATLTVTGQVRCQVTAS